MTKISAIIIAKNEEERIVDCLDNLSFCQERIVVDNNSVDRTSDVSKRIGAKVVNSDSDDFSHLRNLGLRSATGEWVLYIDADERVDSELRHNLENIPGEASAYKIKRKNFYLGENVWPKQEKMERLFKRDKLKGWKGKLHESPVIEGDIGELDGFILHHTHRNLTQMFRKTIEWSKTEASLRYDAGHPKMYWWRFPRVMISTFVDYYIVQGGYKVGTVGLIESVYQSFSIFVTYARLWEMQKRK